MSNNFKTVKYWYYFKANIFQCVAYIKIVLYDDGITSTHIALRTLANVFVGSTQTGIPRGTFEIIIQEVLWSIRGSYSAIWSIPLTNVKWHSDPWPTVTSQPIRLSTNFITFIPSLTFTDYEWFPWSICNGCGMPAGNAYPSGHLVPSLIVGLACAQIVDTRFLELAMSLPDFSPRIPLGTFSILLRWFGLWMSTVTHLSRL